MKKFNQFISRWGYEIIKVPKLLEDRQRQSREGYERVRPLATYAPWTLDLEFQAIYQLIKGHTLVDRYRCYELWYLLSQCAHIEGDALEVGVWRGGTAGIIASKLKLLAPQKQVFLADTFNGVVKASGKDSIYKGGEHADTSESTALWLLKEQLRLDNFRILKGIFPEDTGRDIQAKQFSFCHVDVDVYQSARDTVEWIWPRLTRNGMVVFDDYGFNGCDGVTKYVNEQILKKDRNVFQNLNGHAVMIKQ